MASFVNSISNAIYTTLSSDSTLVSSGVTVCLYDILNTDPNLTPWIGIFGGIETQNPLRLTSGYKPWNASIEFQIFMQSAGFNYAPTQAQQDLDSLWTCVQSAFDANLDLDNTVCNIVSRVNEPFERNIEEDDVFFTNLLTLTVEVEA